MRIPNLNLSQAVTQQIKDLDLQRFKLDQQITSGQKITYAEDDGSKMSRAIKLDSQKTKLAQYQRNSSYASEFLNAGQMNLEKLREINQRAQEIARLSGSGLHGSGLETYTAEIDQLIDEVLNRLNSRHRGKSLFGGQELKPDFAHSDVVSAKADLKIFDLGNSPIGFISPDGTKYLKQGDEVVFETNGREYVVQAKQPQIDDYEATSTYLKGDYVKVTEEISDSILINSSNYSTIGDLLEKFGERDWSKQNVGELYDKSAQIFVLDAEQIQQVSVSLGNQPNIDIFPPGGGYFALLEEDGDILLEPVENKVDKWQPNKKYSAGSLIQWGFDVYQATTDVNLGEVFDDKKWTKVDQNTLSDVFFLTEKTNTTYWEATADKVTQDTPSIESRSWKELNPKEFISNVTTEDVVTLISRLINNDAYFINNSEVYESADSFAFVRRSASSLNLHNPELNLTANVDYNGKLLVSGNVGSTFTASASYQAYYDSNNYYPEQLDKLLMTHAEKIFPNLPYDDLSKEDKDFIWESVKNSKLSWELSVSDSTKEPTSEIDISLSKPWKRLGIYQNGDVVRHEGKLWQSIKNENFNHLPSLDESKFWRELGSDYNAQREDWTVKNIGVDTRYYFSGPDGKLFTSEEEATNHTLDILLNSNRRYLDQDSLSNDAKNLVKRIAYPVSRFDVQASESEGLVYFDASSQTYHLNSFADGANQPSGSILKGTDLKSSSDDVERGDVILHEGSYFLTINILDENEINSVIGSDIINNTDVTGDLSSDVGYGEKIYDDSTGRVYMHLGQTLPTFGREQTLQQGIVQPLRQGAFIFDQDTNKFYVAQEDTEDANSIDFSSPNPNLVEIQTFQAIQGQEWSVDEVYSKGQIVLHQGVYYECQTNGPLDFDGNAQGFNNRLFEEQLGSGGDYFYPSVTPSDSFYLEVEDSISEDSLGLRRARGEEIYNNAWLPISKSLNHVLSFDVDSVIQSSAKIEPAGSAGLDAEIKVMTDINGVVTGLNIVDPGRYFFPGAIDEMGIITIPDAYQFADIVLPNGDSIRADIIWGQNPNDPGPFVITGFELTDSANLDHAMGTQEGDTFSFATGSKTFLDHRDSDGKLIGVSYSGSTKNADFYVGKDSKISSFLDAENGGTESLSRILDSLVDLRNGLSASDQSEMLEVVQMAENELIVQEELVVDKIGELSSSMLRMETVRSHDEDYFLEIEQILSKDLDVDLSDAIMQLTRVSTAYQAAMQVGAQLLNTSLLNYL